MKAYRIAIAIVLVAGLATATASAQEPAPEARQIQVTILGMSCPFCAYGVQQKLSRVEGVTDLKVELQRVGDKVRAYVTDADGKPVRGAYVTVSNGRQIRARGVTDGRGVFEAPGIGATPSVVVSKGDRYAIAR